MINQFGVLHARCIRVHTHKKHTELKREKLGNMSMCLSFAQLIQEFVFSKDMHFVRPENFKWFERSERLKL